MIDDARTVAWKELIEVRRGSPNGRSPIVSMFGLALVLGIVLPLAGDGFGPFAVMVLGPMLATIWTFTSVPDSFAGERDRHTIETLLASRLSDEAILAGKVGAHVAVATAIGAVATGVSVISSNVVGLVRDDGADVGLPWGELLVGLLTTVLVALLFTNFGVLIALRASSALAAQRTMGIVMAGVVFLIMLGGSALPERWQTELSDLADDVGSLDPVVLVLIGLALFVAVNVALLYAMRRRFVRPKLTAR